MLDETGEMTGESNFWSEQADATFPTDGRVDTTDNTIHCRYRYILTGYTYHIVMI